MGFEIRSEIIAPVNPITAEKASSAPRFNPLASAICSISRSLRMTEMTMRTAIFVAKKSAMRFICFVLFPRGAAAVPKLARRRKNLLQFSVERCWVLYLSNP
jgi:hypothetical protein